jgi:pimeloyl-ACP methyl ester carboxylesterase
MDKILIEANNVKLLTDIFGSPENSAVLLIVGAGAVSDFYPTFFCENLAKHGFFVIRYDLRDYGGSTHFASIAPEIINNKDLLEKSLPYRIEDLVDDAKSILSHFNIDKANIIGHSLGGIVAQLFTIFYPKHTSSLTAISSPPASPSATLKSTEPSVAFDQQTCKETMDVLLSNKPTGVFEADKSGWIRSFKLLNGDLPFDEPMALRYIKSIYDKDPSSNVAWNHIAIQHLLQDHEADFNHNKIPSLIIHGEKDFLAPISCAEKTKSMIAHSKLHLISGAGHMFFNKKIWDNILTTLLVHIK